MTEPTVINQVFIYLGFFFFSFFSYLVAVAIVDNWWLLVGYAMVDIISHSIELPRVTRKVKLPGKSELRYFQTN